MSELGSFLKQMRTEQNLSLEQIQEMTKIRKRYLEAIEQGEYSILPGSFYARAFIKSYAEALGLDAEETLTRYSAELPQVPSAPVDTVPIRRTKRKEMRSTSPKLGKWVTLLVLYAFLAFLGFMIYIAVVNYGDQDDPLVEQNPEISGEGNLDGGNEGSADSGNQETGNESGTEQAPSAAEQDAEGQAGNEAEGIAEDPLLTRVGTDGGTTTYEFSNAEHMEITLDAAGGNVWYRLTESDGGTQLDTEELPQGEERTWDLTEYSEVVLRLGDTKGASMSINGESMDIADLPQGHNILIRYLPDGE